MCQGGELGAEATEVERLRVTAEIGVWGAPGKALGRMGASCPLVPTAGSTPGSQLATSLGEGTQAMSQIITGLNSLICQVGSVARDNFQGLKREGQ